VGFRTSIIALFMGVVLFVGLTLVYLSFVRVTSITRSAASSFLDTVAQLSADRIDAQLKTARDGLDILRGLTSVQQGDIRDNPRLHIVLASMLRNNKQLYNLYMGYDDGSFLEMDFIDRAGAAGRSRLGAPDGAKFRLVTIAKAGDGGKLISSIHFLSDTLASISQLPGPADYDPRNRPWFKDAHEPNASLLTEPYVFFATGEAGYTVRLPIGGRRGVVAGDILLS
jgi:adenylate cyclase